MFLQVMKELGDPLAILREAISNSYDASATRVRIVISNSTKASADIGIHDNGLGVGRNEFRYFFGLGFGNKNDGKCIGNKGLGTKLYFNGRRIEVVSRLPTGQVLEGVLDDPLGTLEAGNVPSYNVRELGSVKTPFKHGTSVRIVGLKLNSQSPLMSAESIASYLKWYTVAGSCHRIFRTARSRSFVVSVARRSGSPSYRIDGHELPGFNMPSSSDYNTFAEMFDPFHVRLEDDTGLSLGTLEIAGSIVGPQGHIVTDRRIKKRYKGVFLAKDYFIIRGISSEVFGGTGEWQNTHIVANCQQLQLTMGRDDFVDKTNGSIYHESVSALREFVNSMKRGEPFRYRGRVIETSPRCAGSLFSKLKMLRRSESTAELEHLKALDLLSVSASPRTLLADDGGPVFQPLGRIDLMLYFQALVSKCHSFPEVGRPDEPCRYRVVGYAEESGGYLVLQRKSRGTWSRPLFFKPVMSLNDDVLRGAKSVDGIVCWSNRLTSREIDSNLSIIVLGDAY